MEKKYIRKTLKTTSTKITDSVSVQQETSSLNFGIATKHNGTIKI